MGQVKRLVIPATVILALIVASAAQASGLNLGKRNPTHGSSKRGTRLVGKLGGGALQVSNIGGGPAFTFMSTGLLGGTISVGKGGDSARPFTTNATGVATGLNADRLDGHNASDFLLAGGALDAATLGGKHAGDFLASDGKAANSNLLDGLDSTAFLAAHGTADNANQLGGHPSSFFLPTTGTAADSSELGGQPASAYLPSSTRLSLGANPQIDIGDAAATIGSGGGLTFKATCTGSTGSEMVHVTMAVASGSAHFAASTSGVGDTQVDVASTDGDAEVLALDNNTIVEGGITPIDVSVVAPDGTVYQGILSVGVGFGSSDCFAAGSLSS